MFDINLETVRDFGRYFFNSNAGLGINKEYDFSKVSPNSLEKESSELLDNSNEAIQVRGLTKLEIKSPDHFSKVLAEEEDFRTSLDGRHKISCKRYHSVYVLTMKHKQSA